MGKRAGQGKGGGGGVREARGGKERVGAGWRAYISGPRRHS